MSKSPISRIYLPSSAAAGFIRAFAVRDTRNCSLSGDQQLNRFPAASYCVITWFLDGSVELLSCGGVAQARRLARCVASGAQTHPITSRNCGQTRGYMAVFYADAFHALFQLDIASLQNRFADVREVFPPHGIELVDAVFEAQSDADRQQLIESFVQAHAHTAGTSAWSRVRRMGRRISLSMASALLGTGPRQLQRLALREAGLNFQTLARLLRGERSFLIARRQVLSGQAPTWAEHAAAMQYADQSHMARECKAHTGRTPSQLVRDVQTQEADWIYRLEFPIDEDTPSARPN